MLTPDELSLIRLADSLRARHDAETALALALTKVTQERDAYLANLEASQATVAQLRAELVTAQARIAELETDLRVREKAHAIAADEIHDLRKRLDLSLDAAPAPEICPAEPTAEDGQPTTDDRAAS